MADGRLLDPSSGEYRIVAGLIRSAHQTVGTTGQQWWNGRIGVLPATSRTRSRADLDGTIQLHPRHVIAPLRRAEAGGRDRWWYPKATRDASYNVIYEGLRMAGPTGLKPGANQSLDRALPAGDRSLDRALNEQLTYEIAERVMAENGLADAFEADPPEAANSGYGFSAGMLQPFRINPLSTPSTAAARGLVDGLADATDRSPQLVLGTLAQSRKTERWSLAVSMVAETEQRGVLDALKANGLAVDFTEVSRAAGREWARLNGHQSLTISTVKAADDWGYAIGRDTAGVLVKAGKGLAEVGSRVPQRGVTEVQKPAATRELSPDEVLGPQVSPAGTPTATGATSASRAAARPDRQLDR